MLMSPNKDETAGHGCYCPGDMTVRMREVLARPWVGECLPLALSLSLSIWRLKSGHECNFKKPVTRNEDTNILQLSLPILKIPAPIIVLQPLQLFLMVNF